MVNWEQICWNNFLLYCQLLWWTLYSWACIIQHMSQTWTRIRINPFSEQQDRNALLLPLFRCEAGVAFLCLRLSFEKEKDFSVANKSSRWLSSSHKPEIISSYPIIVQIYSVPRISNTNCRPKKFRSSLIDKYHVKHISWYLRYNTLVHLCWRVKEVSVFLIIYLISFVQEIQWKLDYVY